MKLNAFISHNDKTRRGVVDLICDRLGGKSLCMNVFSSKRLHPGTDFVAKVTQAIVRTDLLVFVVDAEAWNSEWMKWEHSFCEARDAKIIYEPYG